MIHRSARIATSLLLSAAVACGSHAPDNGIAAPQESSAAQGLTVGAVYTLAGVQSGRCLNIAGASAADLAAVELRDCSGGTSQQFRLEAASTSGYYTLRAVGSDKCLDVNGASTSAGAAIIQYACHGGTNQQWSTTDLGDGVVRVASRSSGMVLDAYGAGTANGTKIIQWPSNGGTNQRWKLTEAGAAVTSYTLTVATSGSGTTSPAAGTYTYASGTSVTVTATPASGSAFTGWSGAATGTTNPATVTMDGDKALTATFSSGAGCTPPAPGSKGTNPLFSDQFTADPAALVDGCTFYITCGHDEASAGQNAFVMREWFLLSSTDMIHWTKKVAMTLGTFQWANANAWAGQMVHARNGRYYWYVPVQEAATGAMAIGVAVADSPGGPWTDALGKPLVNDAFEMSDMGFATPSDTPFTIDPTVFVDDDGQAYLHYGGFWRMVEARLNSDMVSVNGRMQESTPQGYFEAPYLIKRDGTYYEIYAAGSNPATIDYATSSSPMGPWVYGGRVLDALPRASGDTDWPTNHAGVAESAGQWYLVYHVSNGPNGGGTYRREVAVDKLTFNANGTIQKVVPSSGLAF